MLLLRSTLADALMYLTIAVLGVLFIPAALWSRAGAYWAIKTYCKLVFWQLRVICNLRVEIRGTVPRGEVIIASKHMSFLDVMMHCHALPEPKFVMKAQLKWAPLVGIYASRIGCVPVHRGKGGKAVAQMVSYMKSSANLPGQTVIYPQGTRVLPGSSRPYKIGVGVLYARLQQPCVPAATNTGVFWARRSRYRHPGVAVLEYLDPIAPGQPIEDFMAQVRDQVETRSDALMRAAGHGSAPGQLSD